MRSALQAIGRFFKRLWERFAALSRRAKTTVVIVLIVLICAVLVIARGKDSTDAANTEPTVTLQSVASFGDGSGGVDAVGTVQSVSEADLLAQSGGTVESVHATLGEDVPAGFVIASLDSAAASAAVLQAQGGYDAAVAARNITSVQSGNAQTSLTEAESAARTAYQSGYTTLDTVLKNDIDTFFGNPTAYGPQLLINPGPFNYDTLSRARTALTAQMNAYRDALSTADSADPTVLLTQATNVTQAISGFLVQLAQAANERDSDATPTQLAALAAARSSIDAELATLSSARDAYNAKKTSAQVAGNAGSESGTQLASANASVEEALGSLRAAQAAYEKTIVRAPIAGSINYLSIHVGDNVTINQHVATVARNNALEVVMHLSQSDADRVAVGDTLTIAGTYTGKVTVIAPALDPTTKQIEVDLAVDNAADLVNGQSVQVALPQLPQDASVSEPIASSTASTTTSTGILLPLTAVKLLPNERDVFTVDATGHAVSHVVTIGDVIGDRIQITSPLAPDLMIVTDARGLSSGDAVLVASSTAANP